MMRPFLSTAALLVAAAPALAQSVADQVVAGLQAQGFERVEITTGPTQLRAEAVRGDLEVEYVYDLRTGALLRQDSSRVDDDDDRAPGVEFDRADEDFVGAGGDDGRDDGRDDDDDSGGGDDRGDDDDRGGGDDRGGDDDDDDGGNGGGGGSGGGDDDDGGDDD